MQYLAIKIYNVNYHIEQTESFFLMFHCIYFIYDKHFCCVLYFMTNVSF